MNDDLGKLVERHVLRFRRLIARASDEPRALETAALAAIEEARSKGLDRLDDRDPAVVRARSLLVEAFEGMRNGVGLVVPLSLLSSRVRSRLVRLRASVSPVFVANVSMESLSGFAAAVSVAIAVGGGSLAGTPFAQTSSSLIRAGPVVRESQLAVAEEGRVGFGARRPSPVGAAFSTEAIFGDAPAKANGEAYVNSVDRIELGERDGRRVAVGDREIYRSQSEGPLLWITCDPESTVKRTLCSEYRRTEDAAKPRTGNS